MSPKKLVSICDLILWVLYSSASGGKSSFSKLVKECFRVFPETFSLKDYPQWPDSRKLDRALRTLRKRKLIKGSPQTFFILTNRGKKEAQNLAKILLQRKLF